MDLVLATSNAHKIREFRSLLKRVKRLDIYSLMDFPEYSAPEESGKTFEENALLKATGAATSLRMWSLSDDSGLVVPALQGAPGIHSSRYAGVSASDKENRKKLLAAMKELEGIERSAYFECVLVLCSPTGWTKTVRGTCEGVITREEKGRYGFGYDPVFLKHDYNQTFAELDESVKNQISHRGKAFEKMLMTIESEALKYY